jgi:hypothetical protein
VTVREGEAKWTDLVEAQRVARGEVDEASKGAAAAGDKLRARIDQVRAKTQAHAQAAQAQAAGQQQQPTQQQPAQQQAPKTQPAKAADPKFHKVVDVKDAAPGTTVIKNPQNNSQAQPQAAADSIEGNCSMCGVPVELQPNDNPSTARCEACLNS